MAVTFTIDHHQGILTFDQPDSKVNLLSMATMKQLEQHLDQIKARQNISVLIVISQKTNVFIAGADIKEIEKITEPSQAEAKAKAGQDILNKLADLSIPTIAVIDGVALGGGCELALACDYRLATFNDKVQIGLPEVNLGFVPGFGGTYRLPRLIGLTEALKMILSGKPVNGKKALRLGLVDRLVPQKDLQQSLQQFIEDIQQGKISKALPRRKNKGLPGLLESSLLGQGLIFHQSRKNVLKTSKGFYPAPLKAVELIKSSFFESRAKALRRERAAFGALAVTEISKNLIYLFYLSEKHKKYFADEDAPPKTLDKCGVIGAGVMGGGIAQLLSARDFWVRLKDINGEALAQGFKAAASIYRKAVKTRRLTRAEAAVKMAKITGTLDYRGFQNVDMVIEAVVEDMAIKKKVFQELHTVVAKQAILATNTSALSVTEMARQTKDPSRVIGFHFFNPVHRMPLVEIITTPLTSKETMISTWHCARRLGKIPILVKDSPGFLVNRLLLSYINEAGRLLEEGLPMRLIDQLATDFGMPMGPFLLSDEVGLDVGLKVLHILYQGLGGHFQPVDIFEKVGQTKNLGKKTGQGYYIHRQGAKPVPNPRIATLIQKTGTRRPSPQEALERMIYIMINEAARCLEEGVIEEPETVDIGMIFGTGFPAFRGGLWRYAQRVGWRHILRQLEDWTQRFKTERFQPAKYLKELAKK